MISLLLGLMLALATAPLPGPVVTEFENPQPRWMPGHRGVDIAGTPGQVVRATAPGTVTFAGLVAGKPVVVVSHGELRTTYEPVTASVAVGDVVAAGDAVGWLEAGHDSCPGETACLHWGLKRGEEYLDPRDLVTASEGGEPRLVADGWEPPRALLAADVPTDGRFVRPPGPVTSRFGMRLHPVLKIWALHDGVDFGLPCGAAVPSIGAGRVVATDVRKGLGMTVVVDHGGGTWSVYGHASTFRVRPGELVSAGQRLADVGSTGYSTGCHLHLTVKVGGVPVDPLPLLGG